ncbi:MAG: hypothetical protein ACTSX7_08855 [Alphaproteobacteria bacterium]
MATLSAASAVNADTEVNFEALADDPALAWQLAQEARRDGKWALASRLVRIAREASAKDEA